MKLSLVIASSLAIASTTQAQYSSSSPQKTQRPVQPRIANPLAPAPLVGGSDSCATPDVITGVGSFAFDNTVATTGSEGQTTVNCIEFNLIGIPNDVWFTWTAPQTGRVQLSTCGSTIVDTKIGVYLGTTCPAAGATATACNDDMGSFSLQSKLFFNVTSGQQFRIQVGVSPFTPPVAVPGPGNFTIEYIGDTCTYDDGTSEDSIGLTNGGEIGWLHAIGSIGSVTSVSAVSTAWGTPGGASIPAGQPGSVAVWDDPNDDGDPNDAVLVTTVATTVQNPGTDVLQTVPLSAPVTLNGVFFVGAFTQNVPNTFALPFDQTSCGWRPRVAWVVGAPGTTLNINTLAANALPPTALDTIALGGVPQTGVVLLQATCGAGPTGTGTPFCFGDGTGTACPCANHSAVGDDVGCLSSLNIGAKLRGTGTPSLAADSLVLQGSQMPSSSCLYFQGTTQQTAGAGAVFGDGKRCAGGSIVRLKLKTNVAGVSQYPDAGDPSTSVKGMVAAPGIRTYQAWYRNAAAFCTVNTFNLSNGLQVTWTP